MTVVELAYPGAPANPVVCGTAEECVRALEIFKGDNNRMDIMQMAIQGSLAFMMEVVAEDRDGDGALKYFSPEGTWASKGEPTEYKVLEFNFYGTPHSYPTDALVPMTQVEAAVREFFELGGGRPTSVQWQAFGSSAL